MFGSGAVGDDAHFRGESCDGSDGAAAAFDVGVFVVVVELWLDVGRLKLPITQRLVAVAVTDSICRLTIVECLLLTRS